MIKLTNTLLLGLIASSLLVGCGSSSSNNESTSDEGTEKVENSANDTDTSAPAPTTPAPTSNTSKFEANVMPVLVTNCQSCHGSNGNFTITSPSATYANISDLKSSVPVAGKYLYDKASSTISHGGGMVITTSSTEYQTIKSWVDSGADFN